METNGIVAYREKLDQVVERYHDFLGDEAESLCREHSIPSAEDLQADLASIEDEDRLLKIGIVGRVNSGKSSLLDALIFDGQRILPEAAIPMTAALTTLSHGETLSAEVEFFTPKDIDDIKKKHDEYNSQLDQHYKEFLAQEKRKEARSSGESLKQSNKKSQSRTSEERARSKATREMRDRVELSAAHAQYTKMTKTKLSIRDRNLEKNPRCNRCTMASDRTVAAGSDVATERSGSAAAGSPPDRQRPFVSDQDRLSLGAVAALFWAVENGV